LGIFAFREEVAGLEETRQPCICRRSSAEVKELGGIKDIEAQLSAATTLQQYIAKPGGLAAVQDKLVDSDNLALCKRWNAAPTLDKIKDSYDQHVWTLTVISKTAIGQAKAKEERVDAYKDVEVDVQDHLTHYEPNWLSDYILAVVNK
jgi:hypothetical protein